MTTPLRRAATGVLAVLLALLCAYLGVRYSSSSDRSGNCATGRFCLYGGSGSALLSTAELAVQENVAAGGVGPIRTVDNRSQYWACLYEKPAFGGQVREIAPGSKQSWGGFAKPSDGFASIKPAESQAGCLSGYERCPERSLCLFQEPSGRGPLKSWTAAASGYGSDWPGSAASVWNRTLSTACLYRNPDYSGRWTAADGKRYDAFVVPPASSTTLGDPYVAGVGSHKLVTDPSAC
ncbi:peptidase inhibitor family I36 protein [Kitasatospora sp. GP82]|uniref:peptidase inhibitor family I36 protein n=1 Tax=Kitasatospora sp. GP82 TaxID=3035089 RepID=UPI0024767200|nr:peptidase inhibitor family I36 protein [Kitasatospora sp. GP82]MDH6127865.1 hypothetical protein [Kitasatospora sp. GP82]